MGNWNESWLTITNQMYTQLIKSQNDRLKTEFGVNHPDDVPVRAETDGCSVVDSSEFSAMVNRKSSDL